MAQCGSLRKKQCIILHALTLLNADQRAAVLRKADKHLINCICECALNVLYGNVKLSSRRKKQLKKHAKTLRRLASRHGSWTGKKKIIVQKGGFLPLLLLPIIETVISSLLN